MTNLVTLSPCHLVTLSPCPPFEGDADKLIAAIIERAQTEP